MSNSFTDFDLSDFWEESDYATKSYISSPLTTEMLESVEQELGYKLPSSYIELMEDQNGGIPKNCAFPTTESTSWAEDHVALTGIMGIGRDKRYSLCGEIGSQFMIDEWDYPEIGIYFADCPSAGHDMICMDYRKNGRDGEPEIVHIDQESDYKITFLASSFEEFIKGLVNESVFDEEE